MFRVLTRIVAALLIFCLLADSSAAVSLEVFAAPKSNAIHRDLFGFEALASNEVFSAEVRSGSAGARDLRHTFSLEIRQIREKPASKRRPSLLEESLKLAALGGLSPQEIAQKLNATGEFNTTKDSVKVTLNRYRRKERGLKSAPLKPYWSPRALFGRLLNPPEGLDPDNEQQWIEIGYSDLVASALTHYKIWASVIAEKNKRQDQSESSALVEDFKPMTTHRDQRAALSLEALQKYFRQNEPDIQNPLNRASWNTPAHRQFIGAVKSRPGGWKKFMLSVGLTARISKYPVWMEKYRDEKGLAGVPLDSKLSHEEETALAREVQRGNGAARDRLITLHHWRAELTLNKFLRERPWLEHQRESLSLIALVGAYSGVGGGLIRAVECFDPEKGTRLASYIVIRVTGALADAAELLTKDRKLQKKFTPKPAKRWSISQDAGNHFLDDPEIENATAAFDAHLRAAGMSGRDRDISAHLLRGVKGTTLVRYYEIGNPRLSQIKADMKSILSNRSGKRSGPERMRRGRGLGAAA